MRENKFLVYLFIGLIVLGQLSCRSRNDKQPIARVYDDYLYKSDIKDIIPEGLYGEDSAAFVQSYIQQWIKEMVIINKARKNVDEKFERQLEDYKNSLIVYEYERQIIDKLLDTVVSNEEIETYYQENKDNFLLKDNIIKVLYVKLDKNSTVAINSVKKLLFRSAIDEKSKLELDKIAASSGVNFYLDDQKWLLFNDLLKEIPIETYNQELFLQNNRNVDIVDNNYAYIARIVDFKIRDSNSPLSLEKENIKAIIINKRKVELATKMHQELLKEAELKKQIEIIND